MIALSMKQRIRPLWRNGKSNLEIVMITGAPKWVVDQVVERANNRMRNQTKSWKKVERRRAKERKMLNTNTGHLQSLGMRQLRTPQRCGCGKLTKMASRHHAATTCFECVVTEKKATTSRPFKAMCAALCLLLVLAGCQAPREVRLDAKIAGQTLNVQVMR